MIRTRNLRKPTALLAATLVLVTAACGDDEETTDDTAAPEAPATTHAHTDTTAAGAPVTTAAPTTTPGTEPTAPATGEGSAAPEFCESFLAIDSAMMQAPEDPAELAAFAAAEVTPNLEILRATLPDEVAAEVTVIADAVDTLFATGDFAAVSSPEFSAAAATAYRFMDDGCGLPVIEVAATDYAFGGVPETLATGRTVFVVTNASAANEAHEMGFAKINDGVTESVEELLALPEEEVMSKIQIAGGTYVPVEGAVSGTIVDLTPGRWAYVCFIPTGSVDGAEGTGAPHFVDGMAGELTVT